ncbi:hypothetical protein EB796_021278 [Bugula neritina]|uniref:Uridylate-specific endoribonuclease n=1 Tax=Bugula neritina TaxID=10212 RepID=A0A7J7J438_BUGNE|nr:hypothetical protein EB796_021278 [Bugula neritina]
MAYNKFEVNEELSELFNKLWDLDENRCEPGEHYRLNKGGYLKNARDLTKDVSEDPLFDWVDEATVFEKPTYKYFIALLDNYTMETGEQEVVTKEEFKENVMFIDAICDTPLMKEAHSFLRDKGKAPGAINDFKKLLYKLWFKLYRRTKGDRDFDSSGFEHVFVGEIKGEDVVGFHNWICFYLQEKSGNIDYHGYFRRGTSLEREPRFITLQFSCKNGRGKPIGGSFIGTSPEFEMALYTVCYLMDIGSKVHIELDEYKVEVTVYGHAGGIGTAYPTSKD